MTERKDHNIQIWVAIIGFISIIGASIIGNLDKFTKSEVTSTDQLSNNQEMSSNKSSIENNNLLEKVIDRKVIALQKIKLRALVIGNTEYIDANRLQNAVNDAKDISDFLKSIGFNVTELINKPKKELIEEIKLYYFQARNGNNKNVPKTLTKGLARISNEVTNTVYLTFYSGRAVVVDGMQYLIPIDAKLRNSTSSVYDFIPISNIIPKRFGIKSENNFVLYSTQLGSVAFEGERTNSPFTKALLDGLESKDLNLYDVFRYVRRTVKKNTHGSQVPWISVSADEELRLSKLKDGSNINGGGSIVIVDACRDDPFRNSSQK